MVDKERQQLRRKILIKLKQYYIRENYSCLYHTSLTESLIMNLISHVYLRLFLNAQDKRKT